ncbi:guanosine polyphosphate pyrophosphohydrolase [Butyrivibrio sp. VCD2006]|uniref:guanosine polyphosphate pyrophosphohydrolase n=1 Tax=Butyrivibrio sp. VCD2006 TaxID=1280664 RepID=UPI0004149E56|nr:guanosine polyphosphate pyrophosphohydrolase [Butyrivibrio sp. VCD2006]
MITLNDYLYNGDTVLKIIQMYSRDLKESSIETGNKVDMLHSNFLLRIEELLVHNEFLTSQSQRIRELYKYMTEQYPFLAFSFKGRIKSLIRAEEKFNAYIVETIYDYYKENGNFPEAAQIKGKIEHFRDLIAYRIVLSMPKCHIEEGVSREETELKYLYEVADMLPDFLERRGFSPEISAVKEQAFSERLSESVRPYFRDYIVNPSAYGYQSLHITLYDNETRSYVEVQLRTKDMDDNAEIGPANHLGYEKRQQEERARRDKIPQGECIYFDEAYERGMLLQQLELSKVDVNMFGAINNSLINDGCGLYRGRLILPFEHLSRFQNDVID